MAIDYTTPVGQVRLLISDVNETELLLDDAQIEGYLALNTDNARRAAADALEAIASSETLVSKAIRTQDLATDGAKVADSLRKHAATLRAQADDAEDDGFVFEIVAPASPATPELTEYPYPYTVWGL